MFKWYSQPFPKCFSIPFPLNGTITNIISFEADILPTTNTKDVDLCYKLVQTFYSPMMFLKCPVLANVESALHHIQYFGLGFRQNCCKTDLTGTESVRL